MKVVRIIARLNVGGPARHVVWLTAGLRQFQTLLVTGIVPRGEDDMGYFAEENGVVPFVIPEMSREISPRDAITIWKLYRLFRRERPDIVHTHTAKAGTAGRIAGLAYKWLTPTLLLGRPRRAYFVHTYHGHVFHSYYGSLKTRLFLAIERTLAHLATDRIVVISPQQFKEIHSDFGVGRPDQFVVVPLGLDIDLFFDWQRRRHLLRAELSVTREEILVGIVGRLTEIKNHRLFLEMAAQFRKTRNAGQDGPRVRFVVIGDGALRPELEAQSRALGIQEDVVFLGTRNDPENFYPALDVVALTSLNEGTPLTLIEAMANGRPCLATAVGGVVDLFGARVPNPGEHPRFTRCERGILAESGDCSGLCAGLSLLVADASLRESLGTLGRKFIEEHYSKERLLDDIGKLYGEMTGDQSVILASNSEALPGPRVDNYRI